MLDATDAQAANGADERRQDEREPVRESDVPAIRAAAKMHQNHYTTEPRGRSECSPSK